MSARSLLAGAASALSMTACAPLMANAQEPDPAPATPPPLACDGVFEQGGFAICQAPRGTQLTLNGAPIGVAGADGLVFVPFERDHGETAILTGAPGQVMTASIAPRTWDISRIDGLPPSKVRARTPEEQAEVAADWATKQEAWKSRADGAWWATGFIAPVQVAYRTSGVFGSQRILNGEPGRVHNGLDYAAPEGMAPADFVGTPVVSPASGTVILADPNMYFEGGFVVVDHGAGVKSLFMHLSEVTVENGAFVAQGDSIGAVGSTGRSTGPHLHWGVRVRGTYVDPATLLSWQPADTLAGAVAPTP